MTTPPKSNASPHRALCLAIDGGTTNTRAQILQGGQPIARATRPVGVRVVAFGGSTEPLRSAVADCVAESIKTAGISANDLSLVCASGMLTSGVGLFEVPHVVAPAGISDLARHVQSQTFSDIAPQPIRFIPGIKTLPGAATIDNLPQIDILRGEESEVFGILAANPRAGPLYMLLPGSHTKLVHVDDRLRITASYTTIGGELMQALAERTILASSIDWPPPGPPLEREVHAGAQFAQRWGLARGGFAVRLADVVLQLDRLDRTWFFVGLVAGSDWLELARAPIAGTAAPLLVGGRNPLRGIYGALASEFWPGPIEVLDDAVLVAAAARGAIEIAAASR